MGQTIAWSGRSREARTGVQPEEHSKSIVRLSRIIIGKTAGTFFRVLFSVVREGATAEDIFKRRAASGAFDPLCGYPPPAPSEPPGVGQTDVRDRGGRFELDLICICFPDQVRCYFRIAGDTGVIIRKSSEADQASHQKWSD